MREPIGKFYLHKFYNHGYIVVLKGKNTNLYTNSRVQNSRDKELKRFWRWIGAL